MCEQQRFQLRWSDLHRARGGSHRVREAVELKANTRRGGEGYLVSLVFYQLLEAIDHKEEPILVYVAEVSRPQPPL